MELALSPLSTDIFYNFHFEEPLLEILTENKRLPFIAELLKSYSLSLNDIKINSESVANNHIHFSKYYETSFFDVSFGLEEVSVRLGKPNDFEQIFDLFGSLFKSIKDHKISRQRFTIQRQCSTSGDLTSFMESLGSNIPEKIKDLIKGKGFIYDINIPKHNIVAHFVIANSIYIDDGLYLSFDFEFSPNLYDFDEAFEVAKNQHDFLMREFNLKI